MPLAPPSKPQAKIAKKAPAAQPYHRQELRHVKRRVSPKTGVIARALRDLESALAAMDAGQVEPISFLGLSPVDAPRFVKLGAGFLEGGDNDRALAAGEIACACAPDSAAAWALKGCALARLKREREAISAFQRGLQLEPDNIRLLVDLGELYIRLLDYGSAAAALKRAIELDAKALTPAGLRAQALVARTLMTLA
jgi:tetratricopeptide (TPR) repeat protein